MRDGETDRITIPKTALAYMLRAVITSSLSSVVQVVIIFLCIFSVFLNVKITCTKKYENWLNFVQVMPKILAVVSFVILTNLYFRNPMVVQQRN